ncbi:MAG: viral A-type inclusion protein [Chitinophagaceae bacterium]
MKKVFFILSAGLTLLITACNNSADKPVGNAEVKTKADTLMDEVMDGHDVGMGKMGKLTRTQQEITHLLDSISKLPAKAQKAAAPYKVKLDSILSDVKSANMAMDEWMQSFNMDSAINNTEERIKYLGSEKIKVQNVKNAILNSLQKADSVLKEKF